MFGKFVCYLMFTLLGFNVAISGEQAPTAIRQLAFMAGSWHCVILGNKVPKGDVERLTYEFAPDWSWMIERSNLSENGHDYWGAQLWGYDARRKKLVAYQFNSAGVFTKSVDGWVGGTFTAMRDYDGAMVTMKKINQNAFDWIIESVDHAEIITERCSR